MYERAVLVSAASALAACSGSDPVRVSVYPPPTAIVFQDAGGSEVDHDEVEATYLDMAIFEAEVETGGSVTIGWIDQGRSTPTNRVYHLQTVRALAPGESMTLRRYSSDRRTSDAESLYWMGVEVTPVAGATSYTFTTVCGRETSDGAPVTIWLTEDCVSGGRFELLLEAHGEGVGASMFLQDVVVEHEARLVAPDAWVPDRPVTLAVTGLGGDVAGITASRSAVLDDMRGAIVVESAQAASGQATVAFTRPSAELAGLVTMEVVRDDYQTVATFGRSAAALPDSITIDVTDLPRPPTGVTADGAGVAWTRSDAHRADARVVVWSRQALFSSTTTWTLIEPDVGDATVLPVLPERFAELAPQGDAGTGRVTLLDITPGDGYDPVRRDLDRLLDFSPKLAFGTGGRPRVSDYDVGDIVVTTVSASTPP